jgi:hypothetical protein
VSTSPYEWRAVENRAFRVGEELKFTLKWGVIKGGNSTMSIPDMASIKDRDAFHIVTEARTVGLADVVYKTRDRNETWLDAQSLSTVKYEKHIREGSFRVETAVELDQVNGQSHEHYERLDRGTTNYVTGPIPANTLDVLGSLYYVRTLPLEVGKSYTLDVYDSRKVWPLVVKVKKREKIKVPAGKFNCL